MNTCCCPPDSADAHFWYCSMRTEVSRKNDKTRQMSNGEDFNAESGEPQKMLFGMEARLGFRNPKSALLHTPKSRMEGYPLPLGEDF